MTSVRDAISSAAEQLAEKERAARARVKYEDWQAPESLKSANAVAKAEADAYHTARSILANSMIDVLDNWTTQPATRGRRTGGLR